MAFTQEIESFLEAVIAALPVSPDRLQQYQDAQSSDAICSTLQSTVLLGWPYKRHFPRNIKPHWKYQGELTIIDNMLLCNHKRVVPESLQAQTLIRFIRDIRAFSDAELEPRKLCGGSICLTILNI